MGSTLSPRASRTLAPVQAHRLPSPPIPPLENGDCLDADEFLRRYEEMPEVKKAELIDGIVYMGSPVRIKQHGAPDSLMQMWLCTYAVATEGVQSAANSTARLGRRNVPQPDGLLRVLAEYTGQSWVDETGLLQGAPELAVEIAASSASRDLNQKKKVFQRAGVREYLVWRPQEEVLSWWTWTEAGYEPLEVDGEGVCRSAAFPGLWLNVPALLVENGRDVLATLNEGLRSPEHAAFIAGLQSRLEKRQT